MEYSSESNCYYEIDVPNALEEDKLRIANVDTSESDIYDQLIEVGSRVKIKIGKKKAKEMSLSSGELLRIVCSFDWVTVKIGSYAKDLQRNLAEYKARTVFHIFLL